MSVKESIIKNSVSGSKTIFKNEIGEKEYSSILRNQSRRRRFSRLESNEVQVVTCPVCGSSEFFIDNIRSEKSCKKCGLVLEENIIDSTRTLSIQLLEEPLEIRKVISKVKMVLLMTSLFMMVDCPPLLISIKETSRTMLHGND